MSQKLFLIPLSFFILSGFFLWQGVISRPNFSSSISPTQSPQSTASAVLGESIQGEKARVTRVIDGDTIEVNLNGQLKKVRYIGMDTPETVDPKRPVGCFGKEASNKNKELVENKEVVLKKDVSETDVFGRLLRFVYVNNIFVNDYLVRQGYARVLTRPPDVVFANEFSQAQQEAQANSRGLWASCQ